MGGSVETLRLEDDGDLNAGWHQEEILQQVERVVELAWKIEIRKKFNLIKYLIFRNSKNQPNYSLWARYRCLLSIYGLVTSQ